MRQWGGVEKGNQEKREEEDSLGRFEEVRFSARSRISVQEFKIRLRGDENSQREAVQNVIREINKEGISPAEVVIFESKPMEFGDDFEGECDEDDDLCVPAYFTALVYPLSDGYFVKEAEQMLFKDGGLIPKEHDFHSNDIFKSEEALLEYLNERRGQIFSEVESEWPGSEPMPVNSTVDPESE